MTRERNGKWTTRREQDSWRGLGDAVADRPCTCLRGLVSQRCLGCTVVGDGLGQPSSFQVESRCKIKFVLDKKMRLHRRGEKARSFILHQQQNLYMICPKSTFRDRLNC